MKMVRNYIQDSVTSEIVKKGDLIGFTGGGKIYGSQTEKEPGAGRSTGPHLHWTFKVGGQSTNPYTYN